MKMLFLCIGIIRLVQYLSQNHLLGKQRATKFVVDAGTGTTAIGIGLAAIFFGCGSVCILLIYLKSIFESFSRNCSCCVLNHNRKGYIKSQ